MKFADPPGANEARVRSGVIPLWLLVTTMLFKVMLPELLTVPL